MRILHLTFFSLLFSIAGTAQEFKTYLPQVWLKGESLQQIKDSTIERIQILGDRNTQASLNFNPAIAFDTESESIEIPYDIDQLYRFTFIAVYHASVNNEERAVWGSKDSQREFYLRKI